MIRRRKKVKLRDRGGRQQLRRGRLRRGEKGGREERENDNSKERGREDRR